MEWFCTILSDHETELFCIVSTWKEILRMNGSRKESRFHNKRVVVIGGSRGLGRELVAAAYADGGQVLAVARQEALLRELAEEFPGIQVLALDATDESAPARVFAALSPDVLIVCAGAIPHAAPLGEQSWEQFSRNWNTDVKMSLLFSQAALTMPLPGGSTIMLISSGAAIGGSPLSGGYAGSKRMQMFLANYAQKESDRRSLGLRFLALAPGNILPETEIGRVAVSAYAASQGISQENFIRGMSSRLTPDQVASAVLKLADGSGEKGNVFLISGRGIEAVS
jgi:NAD(P)-dependent dehydrogenase (short-subunit alcohol dehydrogenase family)